MERSNDYQEGFEDGVDHTETKFNFEIIPNIRADERAKTLKEVGNYLDSLYCDLTSSPVRFLVLIPDVIESLKRGERPGAKSMSEKDETVERIKELLTKTFAQTVEYDKMCRNCCSALGTDEQSRVLCEMTTEELTNDDYCPQQIECINNFIPKLLALIKELGYVKLPESLPVLTKDEITSILNKLDPSLKFGDTLIVVATAQCDAIKKALGIGEPKA